jgi:hypothetical protein
MLASIVITIMWRSDRSLLSRCCYRLSVFLAMASCGGGGARDRQSGLVNVAPGGLVVRSALPLATGLTMASWPLPYAGGFPPDTV